MRETIKSEIKSLLSNKDNPVCVLLKGEWGVGKTHLWKEIEKELKEKNNEKTLIAYVSLFGKENIAQMEQDIKSQIYKMSELKEKFESMGIKTLLDKTFFMVGTASSGILSILGNEIKNAIICFDDFERHSKKLEFRDILGEISVLKENNNCNILMIMHENKLEQEHKKIFDNDKEKIVDYEFTYEPTPQDSFEAIKDNFGDFKDIALEYFKTLPFARTNNIRTIKKIANVANNISQHITNFNELEYEIRKDFFDIIGDSVTNYVEKAKQTEKAKQIDDSNLQAASDRVKDKKIIHSLYFSGSFNAFVERYIKNNAEIVSANLDNEIRLAKERYIKIQHKNAGKKLISELENFRRYYINDFPFDLSSNNKFCIDKIVEFLNNENFTKYLDYNVGLFWLNKLSILDNMQNHNDLKLRLLKEYCKINRENREALNIIINFDENKSQILYDEIIKDNVDNVVEFKTAEKLCEYLNITGKDDEYSMLKFVDANKLKEFFIQSPDTVRICVNKVNESAKFEEMNKFKEKIIEVLGDITTDNKLEKFQNEKAKKILENLKINN